QRGGCFLGRGEGLLVLLLLHHPLDRERLRILVDRDHGPGQVLHFLLGRVLRGERHARSRDGDQRQCDRQRLECSLHRHSLLTSSRLTSYRLISCPSCTLAGEAERTMTSP